MSGKGAKGFIMGKSDKDKDREKKRPTTRSSRAGLQVRFRMRFKKARLVVMLSMYE